MAATPITGSSGLDNINNAFGSIHAMFGGGGGVGGGPTGGGSGAFGLQPQNPFSGNDLTQMGRSLTNLLGSTGGFYGQLGTGMLGTGMGVTQTGLQTMQPSIDFYNKLISGDPSTMTGALAPTAANIANMFSGLNQQLFSGLPSGGYRATAMANSPFAQTQMVGNAALGLQNQAAQGLGQLGGQQAGIGLGIGGLGTTMTGQGIQGLSAAENAVLQKMQLNLQEPSPFQDILAALQVAGPAAKGIAGAIKAFGAGGGGGNV